MAADDSAKIIAKEVSGQMKKVGDQITGPMKAFFPSLIAGLPGGQMLEKSFKALSISNKKEENETTSELKEQTGLLGGMSNGLARLTETLTSQNKTLLGSLSGDDGSLSAAEVEKANAEERGRKEQTSILGRISDGIGDMLSGFLNSTAAGAGLGLGAVLGLIAAPIVTLAAFFKSLGAEIKVLDGLLGGKLSAPFIAIKSYLTKIKDALKIGDKVDDLVLGAKNAIAGVKTYFTNWVGKLKIADKVDDIILGAKSAVASVKSFFSGFAGKLNIVDKVDDIILGAKNSVAGIKSFFSGFAGKLTSTSLGVVDDIILGAKNSVSGLKTFFSGFVGKLTPTSLGVVDDIILGAKNSATSVKSFFTGFKGAFTLTDTATDLLAPVTKTISAVKAFFNPFTTLSLLGSGAGAVGKTAETAVDGAKAGVKSIQGIMATVKSFMSPLRLGMVALDAGMPLFQGIIKFAGTLGTVLGKIFLPITILMSAFDFVTGFMDGYKEDGILGGLEGGLSKAFANLIGMPLDLLKTAVGWIAGVFGFDGVKTSLESFSFATLITDMISGIFDGVKGVFTFLGDLFDFSDLTIFGIFGKLIDIVFLPLNLAINFIKGLFGWGSDDEKEPFSLSGLLFDTIAGIFEWFKGLLNIDIGGLVKKIPGAGKILSWFGFGDEEPPTESPEAKQNTLDKERLEQGKDDQALTAMEMEEISQRMDKFERGKNAYLGRDTQEKYDADKLLFEKLLAREGELERANLSLQQAIAEGGVGGNTIIQGGNTTNVNGGGQSRSPTFVPLSDYSNQWNTANQM